MKRFISATLLATSFLAASSVIEAQDCSNWSNYDLRGTYAQSGSGFIDLSKALPGAGLPSGLSPYFVVSAIVYDGLGGGTGWLSFNMGGYQMNAQYVGYTYSMQANCSVKVSFRLKLTDLGITSGVSSSIKVIVPKRAGDLELRSVHVGAPFGAAPDSSLNLEEMHRISMAN